MLEISGYVHVEYMWIFHDFSPWLCQLPFLMTEAGEFRDLDAFFRTKLDFTMFQLGWSKNRVSSKHLKPTGGIKIIVPTEICTVAFFKQPWDKI